MKGTKFTGILMFVLFSAILAAGIVSAADVPVNLEKIWIDGTEFDAGDTITLLDLEKGQDLDIRVKVTAEGFDDDIQVKASLRGYEYGDKDKTSDITHVFDVEPNATYYKNLELEVPDKMDSDSYLLRISITNRNDDQNVYNFNLFVSSERHNLQIRDVDFSPENGVEAGKFFQAKVRIKNIGAKDEESIKVRVKVPALGISASNYIDMIEADDTESTEEIWIRVPKCADEGLYVAIIEVFYDEMYESTAVVKTLAVTGDVCEVHFEDAGEDEEEEEEEVFFPELDDSAEEDNRTATLRSALEMGLIGLIIALVILGLVIGFMHLAKEKEF